MAELAQARQAADASPRRAIKLSVLARPRRVCRLWADVHGLTDGRGFPRSKVPTSNDLRKPRACVAIFLTLASRPGSARWPTR
jgi:hypothetical protein